MPLQFCQPFQLECSNGRTYPLTRCIPSLSATSHNTGQNCFLMRSGQYLFNDLRLTIKVLHNESELAQTCVLLCSVFCVRFQSYVSSLLNAKWNSLYQSVQLSKHLPLRSQISDITATFWPICLFFQDIEGNNGLILTVISYFSSVNQLNRWYFCGINYSYIKLNKWLREKFLLLTVDKKNIFDITGGEPINVIFTPLMFLLPLFFFLTFKFQITTLHQRC